MVSEIKVSAPILIPKLDLGFGSRYQNLVSVANYKIYILLARSND